MVLSLLLKSQNSTRKSIESKESNLQNCSKLRFSNNKFQTTRRWRGLFCSIVLAQLDGSSIFNHLSPQLSSYVAHIVAIYVGQCHARRLFDTALTRCELQVHEVTFSRLRKTRSAVDRYEDKAKKRSQSGSK